MTQWKDVNTQKVVYKIKIIIFTLIMIIIKIQIKSFAGLQKMNVISNGIQLNHKTLLTLCLFISVCFYADFLDM